MGIMLITLLNAYRLYDNKPALLILVLPAMTIFCRTVAAIVISGTQFVEKGSQILLTCNVTSNDPPQSIDWFLDGRKIQTSYADKVGF